MFMTSGAKPTARVIEAGRRERPPGQWESSDGYSQELGCDGAAPHAGTGIAAGVEGYDVGRSASIVAATRNAIASTARVRSGPPR
jgi:hypothetical protein